MGGNPIEMMQNLSAMQQHLQQMQMQSQVANATMHQQRAPMDIPLNMQGISVQQQQQ